MKKEKSAMGNIVVCAFVLLMLGAFSSQALAESPWPMFQHDPQHTGRSPFVGPQTSNVKWIFDDWQGRADLRCAPTIDQDGTIYLGTASGLYAINPNGTLKWFWESEWIANTPAVGRDGMVYVIAGGSHDKVLAISPDGTLKWQHTLGAGYCNQNLVIGKGGELYVIAGYAFPDDSIRLCLIRIEPDGTMLPFYEIDEEAPHFATSIASPAIDSNGLFYFGYENVLFAINPDGTEKWKVNFGESHWGKNNVGSPTVSSEGIIYVSAGKFRAVSASGQILWSSEKDVWSGFPAVLSLDGTIYISGCRMGWPGYSHCYLYAFNNEGNQKWECFLACYPYIYYSAPIVDADGTIYVHGQTLRAFDPKGTEKWTFRTGYNAFSLSLGQEGTLYVPGHISGYKLYAFGHDTTPPIVLSTSPEDGATDVTIDTVVTTTFSEAMDSSSITLKFHLVSF